MKILETRAKGFTLLEVIIALSITVLVMGVVYTFFFSNNRTLSVTEINSTLQGEGEVIEKELFNLGTQARGIINVNSQSAELIQYNSLPNIGISENEKYKLPTTSMQLIYENGDRAIISLINAHLTVMVTRNDGTVIVPEKILSENVMEFKIRPLDVRMVSDMANSDFLEAPGVEFSIMLNKKKGYSNVEYPVNLIVKFRNR